MCRCVCDGRAVNIVQFGTSPFGSPEPRWRRRRGAFRSRASAGCSRPLRDRGHAPVLVWVVYFRIHRDVQAKLKNAHTTHRTHHAGHAHAHARREPALRAHGGDDWKRPRPLSVPAARLGAMHDARPSRDALRLCCPFRRRQLNVLPIFRALLSVDHVQDVVILDLRAAARADGRR